MSQNTHSSPIWAYLIHLSYNMWADRDAPEWDLPYVSARPYLRFDDSLWNDLLQAMIDQRLLPAEFRQVDYDDYRDVAQAIRTMVVRGAPAIGAAAGFGMALAARQQGLDRKVVAVCAGTGCNAYGSPKVVAAFREELANGRSVEDAVVRTVETAGRTVAFSAVASSASTVKTRSFPCRATLYEARA